MSEYLHYLDGRYVTEEKLLISPRDLGFGRSFGVFDYMRTYNGRPFKLKRHMERLLESAEMIGLRHNYSLGQLVEIVQNTTDKNNDGCEKQIKIILSGGKSNYMYQTEKSTLIVIIDLLKPKKQEIYKIGISMNLVNFSRYMPRSKTTNYIEGVIQTEIGMRDGFYEPLYYTDAQIHEGANSNIFVIKDNRIYTPQNNILYGVTRDVLVNDLKNELHVTEKDFDLQFLLDADEVFVTSSGKEVVPVVRVDRYTIGNGRVGETTKLVLKEFRYFVDSDIW